MILTISSCKSTASVKLEIPNLVIDVEKPVLDPIPDLDISEFTDEQVKHINEVLSVYNLNLGKVIFYSESLIEAYDTKIEYLSNVIDILRER